MASIFNFVSQMKYEEKNWGHLVTFSVMVKPDHSEVASPDHPFLFQQTTN